MKVTVTRILRLVMVLVLLWLVFGWAQYTGEYGTKVSLRFSGQARTVGQCQQIAQNLIRCQVPAGSQGQIQLQANATPARAVNISAVSLPTSWPSFQVASGWGTTTATYTFTLPPGNAGRRYELRFQAWTAGVPSLELRVILDIVARITPTPPPTEPAEPTYAPFSGTTDASGRFEVPTPTLPHTSVTGQLTECGRRSLAGVTVAVALVPKPGVRVIRAVGDIGAVRVSSPGYGETVITELRFASSMDIYGRTYTTVDVGRVCLRPSLPPIRPTQPVIPTEPITGTTDEEGKISVPLPFPSTTVSGRLTECGQRPLPNQPFSITLVPKGEVIASPEDIGGFTISVPGYEEKTITGFSRFSILGMTSYGLGDVCLSSAAKPDLRFHERSLCLAVGPRNTDWETFFRLKEELSVFHYRDRRLKPDEILVPVGCEVGINVWVVNDGDVDVPAPFTVRLTVLAPDGAALAVRDVILRPPGQRPDPSSPEWQGTRELWEIKEVLPVTLGNGLPTFQLTIDPANAVAEKDERNNVLEQGCEQAFTQTGEPKIDYTEGVLKENPDKSWVVGKDRPLSLVGQANLPATRDPEKQPLTGVPACQPYCPQMLRYEWDFGDGTKAVGKTATHKYFQNGRYTITLTTVLGDDHRSAPRVVEVTDKPLVKIHPKYKRVFVHRVQVPNTYDAYVDPNGNTLERVEFILNGQVMQTRFFSTKQPVTDSWSYDLGAMRAWPQDNQLVVRVTARDEGGNPVIGEASLSIPVAPVPSWLEWTLTLVPGPGQSRCTPPLKLVPCCMRPHLAFPIRRLTSATQSRIGCRSSMGSTVSTPARALTFS